MKVLVPVNVESDEAVAAAVDAILDSAWPADVEFHLLNVIEDEVSGGPCARFGCEDRCRCLEPRIRAITEIMRRLESKMPGVPIFVEVAKGSLDKKIESFNAQHPMAAIVKPKKRVKRNHHVAKTALIMAAVSIALAALLVGVNAVPAAGFIPVAPPVVPTRPPAAVNVVPVQNEDELRMQVFSQLGDANLDADDYGKAITYYSQALKYFYKVHASQAKLTSITGGLSISYCGLGKMAEAVRYARMSVKAALAAEPRDMTDISIAYNNLGYLLKKTQNMTQTEFMYEKALAFAPGKTMEDRVRAATIEANLAEVYGINNKLPKALAAYRHSVSVLKKELPGNHPAIREVEDKIRYLEKNHKVMTSTIPMSVTFVEAGI